VLHRVVVEAAKALLVVWACAVCLIAAFGVATGELTFGVPLADMSNATAFGRWLGVDARLDLVWGVAAAVPIGLAVLPHAWKRHHNRIRGSCCVHCGYCLGPRPRVVRRARNVARLRRLCVVHERSQRQAILAVPPFVIANCAIAALLIHVIANVL
jgi:hypothetical protein